LVIALIFPVKICTKTNVDVSMKMMSNVLLQCFDDLALICDVLFHHYGLDLGLDMDRI
jgi:hypothetical protein